MTRRKAAVLVLALALMLLVLTSSGAISTTAVDRTLHGTIAPESDAYLGLDQTATDNESTRTLTVTNQFPGNGPIEGTMRAGDNETAFHLAQGDSATATFACGDSVRIEASNGQTRIVLTQPIECNSH